MRRHGPLTVLAAALMVSACQAERVPEAGDARPGGRPQSGAPTAITAPRPAPRHTDLRPIIVPEPPQPPSRTDESMRQPSPRNVAATQFRPTGDLLGVVTERNGPTFRFDWPEDQDKKRRLWAALEGMGARAVYVEVRRDGEALLGPVDGKAFMGSRYSPLVRITGHEVMADPMRLATLKAEFGDVAVGYVLPRDLDAFLFSRIETRLGRRLEALRSLVGRLALNRDTKVDLMLTEIDGQPITPIAVPMTEN